MATITPTLAHPLVLRLPELPSDDALVSLGDANPLLRFEQSSRGYLIVSPPTASPGNRGEIKLITQIDAWNERVGYGEVRGLTGGIELPKGGQYAPDAFVIARLDWNALASGDRNKVFVPVLPTAVLELLSPSNKTASARTSKKSSTTSIAAPSRSSFSWTRKARRPEFAGRDERTK
jgi:Uma2 family endonuclease